MNSTGNILIADDDLFYRQILSEQICELGYQPVTVSDGMAALKLMRRKQGQFAGLVLDVFMPKLTGLNLLELMQIQSVEDRRPIPPVMIITSDESAETERAARTAKSTLFMLKPFTKDDFKRALMAMLAKKPSKRKPLRSEKCF